MIIDVHTHIFPVEIRQNRQQFFESEAAFKLLYNGANSKMIGARDLIAAMDQNEVNVSVVFGFPWQTKDLFKRHNDYVMDAMTRYPNRLVGFCCFDPCSTAAPAETERCLKMGMAGVGELAFYQSGIAAGALEMLDPVFSICKKMDLPVMVHTNEPVGHQYPGKTPNTLLQIFELVKRFEQNRIILAHWGGGLFFFQLLKKGFKERLKNVFFDTAASPFLYDPAIYKFAADLVGAEKILFGSDYPLIPPKRYLDELHHSGLSQADINRICWENATELLNL